MFDGASQFPFPLNLIPYVVVIGWVVVPILVIMNYRKLKKVGVSGLTAPADLVGKLANSDLLAPSRTIEDRLSELDALLAEGTISRDEHAAARIKIISD